MESKDIEKALVSGTPIAEIAKAIAATEKNPNIDQIVADLKLALTLFMKFKADIDGLHPSVWSVIKFLI